jgi:homoserine dehydrogenase
VSNPLRIAIAGLGNVGSGTVQLLTQNSDLLRKRSGRPLKITSISARDKNKDRGFSTDGMIWFNDPVAMAKEADADVLVELIGGEEGIAKEVCEQALKSGKHVVTANKALLAVNGESLVSLAENNKVVLNYEAAVAGGIPIVKAIREGLAGNNIKRIYGILNGTCNYILTEMRTQRRAFDEVLLEAQKLGYAEAEPSMDVDGIDAAQKLSLLSSLAFGTKINFSAVYTEGIRRISLLDIDYAEELGFRIKLLGSAQRTAEGIEQRVYPCMVDQSFPIAHVEGAYNAIVGIGDFVGNTMFQGLGAGAGPTASAVVADLIDISHDRRAPTLGVSYNLLENIPDIEIGKHIGPYYVRLMVADRPGVIADITAAFRDEKVSIESMIQRSRSTTEAVPVILNMHDCKEYEMQRALSNISTLDSVIEEPTMIRIETLS